MSGLEALFAPRGVAVVGASRDGAKLGAVMGRALAGYPGGCLLVNARNPDPAAGVYASVADARDATGQVVDLAVLCVPAAATAGAIEAAAEAGATAALVCAGGFGEVGEVGAGHEQAVADAVARTGIRLLGPNTSGFFVPALGLHASFVPGAAQVPAGDIAVVASSGGVNHALAFELPGVSLAVGIGAGLDVRATDILDHLAADPGTAAVALHVETVPDGPRLLASIRALTAVKPVVALVVGRGDVGDFARSHTGALATSWRTTRAALRQAGAVVVDDERELVDAVTALAAVRLAPSEDPGIGVVTAQAGPGLLLVDRLRADGLRVPDLTPATQEVIGTLLPPLTYQRNPVDTGRPDGGFADVLRAVADDPGIDLLVGYALAEPDSVDLVAAAQDAGLPATVPAVLATGGPAAEVEQVRARLRKIGIPVFGGPTAAAAAVRALVADACRTETAPREPVRPHWNLSSRVDEAQAKDFLTALGIRVPEHRVCESRAEAEQALAELGGGPVAVKILDAAITHKTEIGGVHLGVRTPAELTEALDKIGGDRWLVEAMAGAGVELVVGACRDPVFGPVVLLGLGGTTAEALADVTIRVAPLSTADAARMPGELAGAALLTGWRGLPALDPGELAAVLVALGDVLATMPELEEIEINPLRVTADGLVALDAVIVQGG